MTDLVGPGLPDWVRFGAWTDQDAGTGASVFHFPGRVPAAVSIRGYGAATRHVDRLVQFRQHPTVDAICLAGGSAFGLGAAEGVMAGLAERGQGEPIRHLVVPIVPTAILFDLFVGASDRWPDADAGRQALAACGDTVLEGCTGAGTGAAVGKLAGIDRATKLGAGWAARSTAQGWMGVYVVVNAFGDVVDPGTGAVRAGLRGDAPGSYTSSSDAMLGISDWPPAANTTLVVGLVEGNYGSADLHYLAEYLQGALRGCIQPCHTPADGDVVFVAGSGAGEPAGPAMVTGLQLERLLFAAVDRAVATATGAHGLPAPGEWCHGD